MPDFSREARAGGPVAGIDEAGRGPWAGPVVAAAVIFERRPAASLARTIDDSKVLSRARREAVLQATLVAMRRALDALGPVLPILALVDGTTLPVLPCPVHGLVGGDALSLSIAAASIVAKVTRDRLMLELAEHFHGYGWQTNVGYGTPEHRAALARLGPCRHHRTSFRPVREAAAGVPAE